MTEQERLNLSLGDPPSTLAKRLNHVPRGWLVLLLLVQLAVLGGLVFLLTRPGGAPATGPIASTSSAAELKSAAKALEDKGLEAEAAAAWQDYLQAVPDASDRAEILYRVGKLRLQADQYGAAATALVRAEQAAGNDKDLKTKIGPLVVECLTRMGRYGEVGRELARRVETGGAADRGKAKVVATISGASLTEADLDRLAERRVDSMLSMQGAAGDETRRRAILQQLSSPAARKQLLQELLQTELFCRRARELKLDQEDDYRQARDQLVQSLLAERFMAKELGKIQPTEVDLESYYKANTSRYEEPEARQAVVIRLAKDDDPKALLGKIKSAEDFKKLAAERKTKDSPADAQDPARRLVRGQEDPLLGATDKLFSLAEGQWTKEPHVRGADRFLVLVDKKIPARTPPMSEIGPKVRADYVTRKQQEMGEKLLQDLTARYEVRITPPESAAAKPSEPAKEEKKSK